MYLDCFSNGFFQLLFKNSFQNDPSLAFPLPRAFPAALSPAPSPLCAPLSVPTQYHTLWY